MLLFAQLIFVRGTIIYHTMDAEEQKKLREKIVVLVPAVFLGLCLIFFVPAGTLDYWETWVFIVFSLRPLSLRAHLPFSEKIRNSCAENAFNEKNPAREGS
jgi:hypothetical protein